MWVVYRYLDMYPSECERYDMYGRMTSRTQGYNGAEMFTQTGFISQNEDALLYCSTVIPPDKAAEIGIYNTYSYLFSRTNKHTSIRKTEMMQTIKVWVKKEKVAFDNDENDPRIRRHKKVLPQSNINTPKIQPKPTEARTGEV